MPRLLAALLLLATTALPAAAAEAPLRTAEVRAFMTHIENASRARDLAQIALALAPGCRIELRSTVDGHEQETLLTRDEYLEVLTNGYAALKDLKDYDYEVTDLSVTLE